MPPYPYTYEHDSAASDANITVIYELLRNFDAGPKSNEYLKLETKLSHTIGRADRMVATGHEDEKTDYITRLKGLFKTLDDKADDYSARQRAIPEISVLEEEDDPASDDDLHEEAEGTVEYFGGDRSASF
ncbi:unnamed protein product [Brassicogethes aeneus]|uniref:Uncharacterized protein n=1 Tax=Brassicogethes aeneus TaxID=1431903 RepID=A0A9P0B388_BRAAE|nr:unnamed protein product [Brassicogethes aeneus]